LPDDQMPKTKDGKPIEVLLNPIGAIARMNLGQIMEVGLSKLAEKQKSPIALKSFEQDVHKRVKVKAHWTTVHTKTGTKRVWVDEYERDYVGHVKKLLKDNDIPIKEEVFTPDGRPIGKVTVGKEYMLKLVHQAEKKIIHGQKTGGGHKIHATIRGLLRDCIYTCIIDIIGSVP